MYIQAPDPVLENISINPFYYTWHFEINRLVCAEYMKVGGEPGEKIKISFDQPWKF